MLTTRVAPHHTPVDEFRAQTRDLYIPGGDIGMWQGAIRSSEDPDYEKLEEAIEKRQPISIELLYSDATGGQRTVSRFGLTPWPDETWFVQGHRHWFLDAPGPRDEAVVLARAEQILREQAVRAEHAVEEVVQPAPTGDGSYSAPPDS